MKIIKLYRFPKDIVMPSFNQDWELGLVDDGTWMYGSDAAKNLASLGKGYSEAHVRQNTNGKCNRWAIEAFEGGAEQYVVSDDTIAEAHPLKVYHLPDRMDTVRKMPERWVAIYTNNRYNSWTSKGEPYTLEGILKYAEENRRESCIPAIGNLGKDYEIDVATCAAGSYEKYLVWEAGQEVSAPSEEKSIVFEKREPLLLSSGSCYFCGVSNCEHLKGRK
jgi:hypothetical protein